MNISFRQSILITIAQFPYSYTAYGTTPSRIISKTNIN